MARNVLISIVFCTIIGLNSSDTSSLNRVKRFISMEVFESLPGNAGDLMASTLMKDMEESDTVPIYSSCTECSKDYKLVKLSKSTVCIRNMGLHKLKNGQNVCEVDDGHLPLPKSELEQAKLQAFVGANYDGVKKIQLNLDDNKREGKFVKIHGHKIKGRVYKIAKNTIFGI